MDTYIFQQRFRVYPDGTAENADMRIIPCSISSQKKVNDFKPTPKDADGAQALLARLDQLNAQFEKAFSKTAFPPFRRIRQNGSMPIKQLKSSRTSSKKTRPVPKHGSRLFICHWVSNGIYTRKQTFRPLSSVPRSIQPSPTLLESALQP